MYKLANPARTSRPIEQSKAAFLLSLKASKYLIIILNLKSSNIRNEQKRIFIKADQCDSCASAAMKINSMLKKVFILVLVDLRLSINE